MKGRRIEPNEKGWLVDEFQPGDFGRAQPTHHADGTPVSEGFRAAWWQVRAPNGHSGCLDPKVHTVTEHEDGSITVSPSIVINDANGRELYHGWLERGVWRNC